MNRSGVVLAGGASRRFGSDKLATLIDGSPLLGRSVGAMVFPIGLGPTVEREVLDRLASESGGTAYYASQSEALADQFRQIIDNLRRRFVLGYTSTNSTHDGAWRPVEIRVRGGTLSVSSLGGYFAPDP